MRCIAVPKRSLVLALLLATSSHGEGTALDRPIYCEVYLKDARPSAGKISGDLIVYSDTEFTIRTGSREQTLAWTHITPTSAFVLRQRLIDKTAAGDWLALGEFGWKLGAADQARAALRTAVRLDNALKETADRIIAAPAGELIRGSEDAARAEVDAPQSPAGDETGPVVAQPGRSKGDDNTPRVKYTPATPQQHAAAIERAKKQAAKAEELLGVTLQTFETEHFIVFTDWDSREFSFLKNNLEGAYAVVARQFDISPKENVFVGKLPVYMWAKYSSFKKYASELDDFGVSESTAGYYSGNTEGVGHLSMWKPTAALTGTDNIKDAETLWGYVLVHEFTHAFVARYRTNERIPRWMNEGIAEVIAMSQVPMNGRYTAARMMAGSKVDVSIIFDDERMPSGAYYPVMLTMVEMLVSNNRKTFIKMIDAIKDGADPETALRQHYNTDYANLAEAWRKYAQRLTKN